MFELSDEEIAELRKEQAKKLAVFRSRAKLTPEERKLGRAIELEAHHRKTGNVNALAEALADQGRFREAASVATRDDLKSVLVEKADAVDKPDDNCACPDHIDGLPTQYVQADVYSVKHKSIMPAVRCTVCNDLNVRPMPVHLAEQRAARAHSVANQNNQIPAAKFFNASR